MWWLDATIAGVQRPALMVTVNAGDGSAVVGVCRGNAPEIVQWDGSRYWVSGVSATRAVADEIWNYITANFDIVWPADLTYTGIVQANTSLTNNGPIGGSA